MWYASHEAPLSCRRQGSSIPARSGLTFFPFPPLSFLNSMACFSCRQMQTNAENIFSSAEKKKRVNSFLAQRSCEQFGASAQMRLVVTSPWIPAAERLLQSLCHPHRILHTRKGDWGSDGRIQSGYSWSLSRSPPTLTGVLASPPATVTSGWQTHGRLVSPEEQASFCSRESWRWEAAVSLLAIIVIFQADGISGTPSRPAR